MEPARSALDENALTRSEAQAFKRACSCFGLGRYFYDLPPMWVDLDENRRPVQLLQLPEWALPARVRHDSAERTSGRPEANSNSRPHASSNIGARNVGNSNDAPGNPVVSCSTTCDRSQPAGNGQRTNGIYGSEIRKAVQDLAEQVGYSLTRSVVQAVAGKEEIAAIQHNAQLTSVREKLTDLARGVARLKLATGALVYARLCRELNLASDSIDDIPNREVLRQLVNRMEAAAKAANPQPASAPVDPISPGANGSNGTAVNTSPAPARNSSSGVGIAPLRDRLLVEARRVSTACRKGIGDVIAVASHGSFAFANLTKFTNADIGKVEAALEELARVSD